MNLNNLKIIYSPVHQKHNPPFEIYDGKMERYSEVPDRIEEAIRTLIKNNIGKICSPQIFPMSNIYEVHQKDYVDFFIKKSKSLKSGEILYPSYYISDTYAPITSGTFDAAKMAVDGVLTGAKMVCGEEKIVYCLCRPPGHHAGKKSMGGYCYFNNAAIGANYLSKFGRVAILDIDLHHGNGTQDIFYQRSDVLYVSIHADPKVKYPYSSGYVSENKESNINYPLPMGTTNQKYLRVFGQALENIRNFGADYLVVSVGFDTYQKDPIGGFNLTTSIFAKLGQGIANMNIPILAVQEGGYFVPDFGKNLVSFLSGLTSANKID